MDREDIRSIKGTLENRELSKGVMSNVDFESSLRVSKTGKQVKEKLKDLLVEYLMQKNSLFREMDILITVIGTQPSDVPNDYELMGLREKIQTIPLKYAYKELYPDTSGDNVAPVVEAISEVPEVKKPTVQDLKRGYNSMVGKYLDKSVDCLLIKTTIDGVKDDKSYDLNVHLATKLGF